MTAHRAKRTGFFVALAVLSITQLVAVAHSAPVPNLVLTCSDENAIGQNQDACHGIWAYQLPSDPLIVSSGSSYVWRVFGDLIGADTVLVCTLPVEPGQYSSCRDASGVRRIALVRKDSIMAGGSVTVSKAGGDYADPVTAAKNAFEGDSWCVAPAWPEQPCVMAMAAGVYILSETLSIPAGLAVSGAGKGATMLVADTGLYAAVGMTGNGRLSGVTIVNRQPGLGRAVGLADGTSHLLGGGHVQELDDVAIHVMGATENIGISGNESSYEIADSEIDAEGAGSIGIDEGHSQDFRSDTLLQRSRVSAETAVFNDNVLPGGDLRLVDSHVSGRIWFIPEWSLLEILRSHVQGDVTTGNDWSRAVVTDSSIQGDITHRSYMASITYTNTAIAGNLAGHGPGAAMTLDRVSVLGELTLQNTSASLTRSRIVNSKTLAPAISLRSFGGVGLEQTFVSGTLAVAAFTDGRISAVSSVLAGPLSGGTYTCTDTYGADYELLTASCQPQLP